MKTWKVLFIGLAAISSLMVKAACPQAGEFQAVDLSKQVDQNFLDKMRQLGVHTVIRYYDDIPETLPNKTLRLRERELIQRNGFSLIVVFQRYGRLIETFTEERARKNADRSLFLAGAMSQPRGSAIYFSVDEGWSAPEKMEKIKTYFRTAKSVINRAGYKMGAYGSGLVCKTLLDSGLAEYCWLAGATGWPGYKSFFDSKRWSLVQELPQTCAGRDVDFNRVNPDMADIGQFD